MLVFLLFSPLAFAGVQIEVAYREPADIFDIMDSVSQWWPGFTEVEYQKYWDKKFGSDEKDKELFKKYGSFREKYYNDPDQKEKDPLKNRNGFFSTLGSINADPVAEAFYSSSSMAEAFGKLKKIITPKEFGFLKDFYKHFEPRYSQLTTESKKVFPKAVTLVKKSTSRKGIREYLERVADFYNVKVDVTYTVIYVWWPPLNRTYASPTGKYLVMRYNPIKHSKYDDSDIVMHEIIHTISAKQSLKQKKTLTKEFLNKCSINGKMESLRILEEPLAVIFGQMLFIKQFIPNKFRFDSNWYSKPWISMFAKLSMPVVEENFKAGKSINDNLIPRLSKICAEAVQVSTQLAK